MKKDTTNKRPWWPPFLAVLYGLMLSMPAIAGESPEGWAHGDQAVEALEAARERGQPVALLFLNYDER